MVSHPLVGQSLQICRGLIEAGCQNLDIMMEGVMYPFGYL